MNKILEHTLLVCTHLSTTGTNWASIVYTGQKNSEGKAADQVIVELLEKFPQYDLVSDEGIQKAIEEIGTMLDEVGANTNNVSDG